eukprot:2456804-Prymnesium_polylepis.1
MPVDAVAASARAAAGVEATDERPPKQPKQPRAETDAWTQANTRRPLARPRPRISSRCGRAGHRMCPPCAALRLRVAAVPPCATPEMPCARRPPFPQVRAELPDVCSAVERQLLSSAAVQAHLGKLRAATESAAQPKGQPTALAVAEPKVRDETAATRERARLLAARVRAMSAPAVRCAP